MQVGFKLEKYMSSVYVALLNTLMLFVLFLQDDPSEIVLNAIAIEFVMNFANEAPRAMWCDPTNRYIRAGCCELVFRSVLDNAALSSSKLLCHKFDIDEQVFRDAVKGDGFDWRTGVHSAELANEDSASLRFQDPKQKVWTVGERYALQTKNQMATWVFKERNVHFDVLFSWLSFIGLGGTAIFRRYQHYQTWSRWEKILFLSPCSKVRPAGQDSYEVLESYVPRSLASYQDETAATKSGKKSYLNDSWTTDYDVMTRFVLDIVYTLTLRNYYRSVRMAIKRGFLPAIAFRIVDGIVEVFAYLYQILFPFTLVGFMILLFSCY